MTNELQEGNVSFVHFPGVASTAHAAPTAIATFPHPVGSSRGRGGPVAKATRNGALIGESPEMTHVAAQLRRVASTQATVMLVGESGTGKELAAQFLHAHSARSSGPIVAVNCGAIPANLVEAELFGYERGAFTGAVRQHQGYFERAAGGTLLLDEITEMPLDLQTKMLRVLETGRMVRVGGTEEIAVDVRIVTASNHRRAILRDRRLGEDLSTACGIRRAPAFASAPGRRQAVGARVSATPERRVQQYKRFDGTLALHARIRGPAMSASSELRRAQLRTCDEARRSDRAHPARVGRRPTSANAYRFRLARRSPMPNAKCRSARSGIPANASHGGNARRKRQDIYNKLVGDGCAAAPSHADSRGRALRLREYPRRRSPTKAASTRGSHDQEAQVRPLPPFSEEG
jgi:hypothetical protein